MSILKKFILFVSIAIMAAFCVLIYWNQHLYYEAEKIGNSERRIKTLEKANKFLAMNDLVFYNLGKAYLDLGMNSLDDQGRSSIHLQKSINYFTRSLILNPTSNFGHFYLAQSFYNMSLSSPSLEEDAHEQYKKAAHLAGENIEIYYEIGKVFLSRWQSLSFEDKDFTLEILKKIMNRREKERLQSLFYLWEINVKDYKVMEKILSEDPQIYRDFAEFLGEKSMSLEERQKYLAKAEFLDFQRARDAFEAGEYMIFYYRVKEALDDFKSCHNILNSIRFYQNLLTSEELIELSEYKRLWKLTLLNLVKVQLEMGEDLRSVNDFLWEYLEREDRITAFEDIESYLKGKGLIGGRETPSFNDLDRLSLELYISFRQRRFDDNISKGRNLPQRIIAIPDGKEVQYVKILETVGESLQKVDFIYDSNDFYTKALEWDPDNLDILVKLLKNYERLNSDRKVQEINRRIEEIISPREIPVERPLYRGQRFRRSMVLDGREIDLSLQFRESSEERDPLITVLFNGRVIWENYLKGKVISISVESKMGENVLEVVPVNRGVELVKITYE